MKHKFYYMKRALKLAEKLDRYGIKIIGTTFQSLDLAEDRELFADLVEAGGQ